MTTGGLGEGEGADQGHPAPLCYLLPGPSAFDLAQGRVGKLAPVVLADAAPEPFTRLDSFDQTLRQSGRMLLAHGAAWEVILPSGLTVLQTVQGRKTRAVDLAEGPLRQALADMSPLRRLLPFGSGVLRHTALSFADDSGKTRCRADLLSLIPEASAGATLVRLQGLRGYDKALAALRRHLEGRGGTPFTMSSLHDLLGSGPSIYRAKPPLGLTADLTAYEAASQIIARLLPVLTQNEAGIIADHDTEFLHHYRVALRKIRSVLSLFKGVYAPDQTAQLKERFARLMARTGALRDLDVQLLERQSLYDALPARLHPGLDRMFALRRAERATAFAKLTRHLNSRRHAQDVAELSALFAAKALVPGPRAEAPFAAMASALIWKRFKAARRIALALGPDTPDPVVHGLRIQVKKLRYMMDFAADLYPRPALQAALKTVKQVQTHLGQINDLSVQVASLHQVMHQTTEGPDREGLQLAHSLGALTAVLHHRQKEARGKTPAIVATFADPRTRDMFRALFHPRTDTP